MKVWDKLSTEYSSGSYAHDLTNLVAYEENAPLLVNGTGESPTFDGQNRRYYGKLDIIDDQIESPPIP